jgi:hypothetical protein
MCIEAISIRSYLKNVFWPPAFFGGIGAAFQILDIQQYASGLKLSPAAILNQNPIFEMASNIFGYQNDRIRVKKFGGNDLTIELIILPFMPFENRTLGQINILT